MNVFAISTSLCTWHHSTRIENDTKWITNTRQDNTCADEEAQMLWDNSKHVNDTHKHQWNTSNLMTTSYMFWIHAIHVLIHVQSNYNLGVHQPDSQTILHQLHYHISNKCTKWSLQLWQSYYPRPTAWTHTRSETIENMRLICSNNCSTSILTIRLSDTSKRMTTTLGTYGSTVT